MSGLFVVLVVLGGVWVAWLVIRMVLFACGAAAEAIESWRRR